MQHDSYEPDYDDIIKDIKHRIEPENIDILIALLSSSFNDHSLSKWGILIIYTPPAHERFED